MKRIRNLFLILCLAVMALTVMASPAFAQPWLITSSVAGGSGTISPTDPAVVNGTNKSFIMTPAANYHISDVLIDGVTHAPLTSPYTFTNVTADHTIAVTFSNVWTITVTQTGNGTITPDPAVVVNGTNQSFVIAPSTANYHIATLTVDAVLVPAAVGLLTYTHTFTNVTAAHTITATFSDTWTITTTAGANGTVLPANPAVVNAANQVITITPAAGYHIATLTVDAVAVPAAVGLLTPYLHTFTNVTAIHTIAATFAINTYTITASVTSGVGTVTPAGVTTVNDGATPTYTITPNTDYSVGDVLVNGGSVGPVLTYTFGAVHANQTISATFTIPSTTHNFVTKPVNTRRISANTNDVRVLAWSVTSGSVGRDSLKQVTMTSYIERAYAAEQYSLWAWDATDGTRHNLKTINAQNSAFETFDEMAFTDCLWYTDPLTIDTFYILMNANTDYINANADVFDITGVKIKVLTGDVLYSSDVDGSGPTAAVVFSNVADIENPTATPATDCISGPPPSPCYEIEFDTQVPACSLKIFSDSRLWYQPPVSLTTTALITSNVAIGALTATLGNVTGLVVGSSITLNNGTNTETVFLTAVNLGTGLVTWVGGLANAYIIGNAVTYLPGVNLWDGCRPGTVDLGDTIAFEVDSTLFSRWKPALGWAGMTAADRVFNSRNFPIPDSFRIDMSHYASGTVTPLYFKLLRIPVQTTPAYQDLDRHWALKYAIPDSVLTGFPSGVRVPIDTLAGLKVYASFRDSAMNYGQYITAWDIPVDTKRPVVDSKTWSHFYNVSGLSTTVDTVLAIGDSLRFTVVTRLSEVLTGIHEVATVSAHFYQCGLVNLERDQLMADIGSSVVNGNTTWELKIAAEAFDCPRDLDKGVNTDKRGWVVFTITDNACNTFVDSIEVAPKLDLNPPGLSTGSTYTTYRDVDQNGCTGIGDTVRVRIGLLEGVTDVVRVYSNHLDAGIGSTIKKDLTKETGDSVWSIKTLLIENDPAYAKDDNPLKRNGDGTSTYDADARYTDSVVVEDDAGNIFFKVMTLDGGGGRKLDTRRPLQVKSDAITVTPLPFGVLKLRWPRASQDIDAAWFYVYSDSGKGGSVFFPTNSNEAFGSLGDGEVSPGCNAAIENCWTSDALTHGGTYKFVVRTVDNCGNFDLNTTVITGMADAFADKACVAWPDPGKFWGTNNPLNLTATTTASDLVSAYPKWRKLLPDGTYGDWTTGSPVAPDGGTGGRTFHLPGINPGTTAFFNGDYQLVLITTDIAGNVLSQDSAETCLFTFSWNVSTIETDILSINGAGSPQTSCGFDVVRDDVNTFIATVHNGVAGNIYTVDAWVIYRWIVGVDTLYDSTRVAYKDSVAIPYADSFLVKDWPKSNDGIPTTLYVKFTDTRNGTSGIDMVTLCVPDEVAPDIRISSPLAYRRVPIAKTSLNSVLVEAKVLSTSYDPDSPIRVEFWYKPDVGDSVKIDETGTNIFNTGTFRVQWKNFGLTEGWYWLWAVVHDNVDNTSKSPLIKVWLDPNAPVMDLSITQAMLDGDLLKVSRGTNGGYLDLVATAVSNPIDIKTVEFFISYRDSVDLLKWYHLIGAGVAANNNSIWTYHWNLNAAPWATVGQTPGWLKCGYDYKLRLKITDIAGNVYDDYDGSGNFDDYTFWANPWAPPIDLTQPSDMSKKIFMLDCGAPQVAISKVTTDTLVFETPSSLLGGTGVVFAKYNSTTEGVTIAMESVLRDSLDDLGGITNVEYFFKKSGGTYAQVGSATASPFSVSFDPFAMGLITVDDVKLNENQSSIKAVLTDNLGQTTEDVITCWMLDDFPGMIKWQVPNVTYVWGEVNLGIWALNADVLKKVTYKLQSGSDWINIANVSPLDAGATANFTAVWHTFPLPDGPYTLGVEVTDQNDNVTTADDNPKNNVIVQNALPTVTISSPTDGEFFCVEPYFTADATNGPVGAVDFQYKEVTDAGWTDFEDDADNFPPFGKYFVLDHEDSLSDGYYHFRAFATNQAGRTAYSTPITLFYDGTAPLARLTKLDAEGDFADIEYNNDGSVSVDKVVGTLNITAVAFDTLSAVGSQAIYNSGVAWVGLYLTGPSGPGVVELAKEYPDPADSGYYTFTWNISGLAPGQYKLVFEAWDKTGCNVGNDSRTVYIRTLVIPTSLVAGFWQPVPGTGKIVGVTYEDESVQFQYKQTGDWIPIGIGRDEGVDKSLFYPDQRWQTYSVYSADWAPADGAYQLRMLTGYGEDYSPVLSVTIAGGVMTAVGPTTGTWGPGTIEKNQEEGCELQGVARFASTFGFPFAVSISMDLDDLNFEYELVDFRNLPQQTPVANYAGPFQFYEMEDGGPAWGQVFFCDNVETVGYSYGQHLAAYWITQDLGSGGPITYVSVNLKDTTTVSIPPEWNDDIDGYDDALVIWESSKPAQCVVLDWLLTPVGNRSGLSNYVGAPGDNCDGDNDGEGDDERYAIVKMTYDATCNIPQESLMVAWWDGEGDWLTDDIFFPSTVEGFNTIKHTVEFAATNLHGTYAVIKRTPNVCQEIVTRKDALPMCGGQYTSGYPTFWYQFVEAFLYTMDWTTLQVKVDGILVYDGGNYYVNGVKVAPNTALDDEARHWDIDIDQVSAVVSVKYSPPDEGVLDDPLPLACGAHTIWISAKDTQLRGQCLTDPFVVDCTKPVVTFPNSYVGKDPTIQFTITDDLSGVEWDSVYADVFFITKTDSADYYGDYYTKERVAFIQTFFPGQIENYLSGNTVTIPTSYNLENVRAIIVVVYNGHRRTSDDPDNWGIDPSGDYFYEYYMVNGGAPDCVGNNATPHVQYFTVDAKAPSITQTKDDCPMMFTIADDGSGISASDIVIREDGIALSSSAQQSTASAVNGGGKWYFAPSGGGGVLYYCPTAGAKAEIAITDGVGNEGVKLVGPVGPIADGDLTVTMSNNPFDPAVEHLTLYITLKKTATVTAKIYDMGGDLVRTLSPMVGENLYWDGKTEGGTTIVANGVYLAHIVAEGSGGSVSTVVKIAVVKK